MKILLKSLILFVLLIISQPSLSQILKNYVNEDTETHYKISSSATGKSTNYTNYDNGNINYEGDLTDVVVNGVKIPMLGSLKYYISDSYGGDLMPKGINNRTSYLSFYDGKLNGLQQVMGMNFNSNYTEYKWVGALYGIAIINGVIVGQIPLKGKVGKSWMSRYRLDLSLFGRTVRDDSNAPYREKAWQLETFEENDYYELETMVKIFLNDFKSLVNQSSLISDLFGFKKYSNNFGMIFSSDNAPPWWDDTDNLIIDVAFEPLEKNVIATAYGKNNDAQIILRVNPDKWLEANPATRWYILYHELGHDVLNLNHGQGGRMMFNYPTETYDWVDFFKDRNFMFDYVLKKFNSEYESIQFHLRSSD